MTTYTASPPLRNEAAAKFDRYAYQQGSYQVVVNPLPVSWTTAMLALPASPIQGLELGVEWPDPEWSELTDARRARYGHTSVATNSRVLVVGGNVSDTDRTGWAGWSKTLEAYDIPTKKWIDLAPPPVAITNVVGHALLGNVWYLAGGSNGGGASYSTLYAYDIKSDTWSTRAPLPGPARSGGLAGSPRQCQRAGKLYAFGGIASGNPSALAYVYDPLADEWTRLADIPTAVHSHGTCRLGPSLYVAGGSNGSLDTSRRLYEYRPSTDTWTARANMPQARMDLVVRPLNGKLVAAGGRLYNGNGMADTWMWDPTTNIWELCEPAPRPFYGAGAAAVNEIAASIITGGTNGGADEDTYPISTLHFGPPEPSTDLPLRVSTFQIFPAGVVRR